MVCAAVLSRKAPHPCLLRRMRRAKLLLYFIQTRVAFSTFPFKQNCVLNSLPCHGELRSHTLLHLTGIFSPFRDHERPQLFSTTSAVCPVRQFAMTVSSQWSGMSRVSLGAVHDSLRESSLGVTHA